jgi:hypothetical protein
LDTVCKIYDDYFVFKGPTQGEQANLLQKQMQKNNELFELARKRVCIKNTHKDVMKIGLPEVV